MHVLVLAPHADDEVLGLGGTLSRLTARGHTATVAILTEGWEPLFKPARYEKVKEEARQAGEMLGIRDIRFLGFPATRLNEEPRHELNARLAEVMDDVEPSVLFLPFAWDRHEDHRQVFEAGMVISRPSRARPYLEQVICYEVSSETHWVAPHVEPDFAPNLFVDVTEELQVKLAAMRCYETQLQDAPAARSLTAIESLARWRGNTVAVAAAEAFMVMRRIVREPDRL